MKAIEITDRYGVVYHIEEVTAIATFDDGDETCRQPALLVTSLYNGEPVSDVVFGWKIPANLEDFEAMCKDLYAWEPVNECYVVINQEELL
jgi:hypothetical protein